MITVTTEFDPAEWDAFVENASAGTFCHLLAWRGVIERSMRQQPHYLAARSNDGTLRGVMPLVRMRSRLFGTRWVSVPYLNDGGPLGDAAAASALRDEAVRLADGARVELRLRDRLEGWPAESRKVTVLLDLAEEPDTLWSALPSKVRSQVRRPQKAGMTSRFGPDQLDAFYDVWSHNMRDLGTPVLPKRFFEEAGRAMPDRFLIGCVYRGDEPVAAGAGFVFRDEFEITWASSLRSHNRDAPNMLLYWDFMVYAMSRGARTFNFGRCTPGEGTHRFKMQWGSTSVPLHWFTSPNGGNGEAGPGRLAVLASGAWQKLPVPVATTIGPTVARELPWW